MRERFNVWLRSVHGEHVQVSSTEWNRLLKVVCGEWGCTITEMKRRASRDWGIFTSYVEGRLTVVRTGCGKIGYRTKKEAKRMMGRKQKGYKGAEGCYECAWCGQWHITSNFKQTKQYYFKWQKQD